MFPRRIRNALFAALAFVLTGFACTGNSAVAQDWQEPQWVMSKGQAKRWRTQNSIAARQAMGSSSPTNQQVTLLTEYVHYYMSQLLHEPENPIRDVVDRLLGELNRSTVSSNVRTVMMDEILAKAPDLLTHPEPQIRTDTMVLVIQLSSVPYTIGSGIDVPVPYVPANKLMLKELKNDQQFLEVRILAARGLGRIARDGSPSSLEKSDIAIALVDQLNANPPSTDDERWWYRYRLIEALGYVDRLDNTGGKPIVIDTLLRVIADPKETWINRAQASLSISRLPFTGAVNVPLITHEVAKLLSQMIDAYNKSPKASIWKHAFSRVYLSFKPANSKEAGKRWGFLEQVKRPGVTNFEGDVLDLWDASFGIFKAVLTGPQVAIPNDQVTELATWIKDNDVQNRSVVPGAPALAK